MSKPFKGGAYAYQRFNFVRKGQAHERNAEASNRTWEIRPYGIIGGPPETWPWWKWEPASQSKERGR